MRRPTVPSVAMRASARSAALAITLATIAACTQAPETSVPSASPTSPGARASASPRPVPSPAPPPSLCDTYVQAILPSRTVSYPTATAAQVRSALPVDPTFRHLLEDIAGVRQDSNPLRDPRVTRCDVAGIELGEPVFVRTYPTSPGVWYVPVRYPGEQLMLATVGRDASGLGSQSGGIALLNRVPWPAPPTPKPLPTPHPHPAPP